MLRATSCIVKPTVARGSPSKHEYLEQKGREMESFVGIGLLIVIAWWFYRSGKRIGSRKGYNVGRSRGRRSRR